MCAAWHEEMDVQGLGACSEDAAQVAVISREFRRKPVSAKKRHGPKKAPGVPLWVLQTTEELKRVQPKPGPVVALLGTRCGAEWHVTRGTGGSDTGGERLGRRRVAWIAPS